MEPPQLIAPEISQLFLHRRLFGCVVGWPFQSAGRARDSALTPPQRSEGFGVFHHQIHSGASE